MASILFVASTWVALFTQIAAGSAEIKGRVLAITDNTVTIAVRAGIEPPVGDKVEIYIELPDLDGIAVLATGRVSELRDGVVIATLDSKNGRIDKNQLARITSAGRKPKPADEKPKPPVESPAPSIVLPDTQVRAPMPSPTRSSSLDVKPPIALPNEMPRNESVPIPAKPFTWIPRGDDFTNHVANYQRAIVFVGDPEARSHGTGFVISRKHRLVATNAHVADISKIAVLNESRTSYKVIKKWYHPGVIRVMDDGKTRVLSTNSSDGDVWPECADIAVLQLEAVGADLPTEVALALPQDAYNILGASVGMLGYPGYQRDQKWTSELFASATFVKGTISRMTGLGHNPDAAQDRRHLVHFDANSYKGFSGSPVFSNSGKCVVINNHIHLQDGHTEGSNLAYGIRVDALWELIDHAGIADMLPNPPQVLPKHSPVNLPSDPRVEKMRRVQKLLDGSADRILHDEFQEAQTLLRQALEISPDYWRLHWQYSKNINHYLTDEWDEIESSDKVRLLRESIGWLEDASRLYALAFNRLNPKLVLDRARELISLGRVTDQRSHYDEALRLLSTEDLRKVAGGETAYIIALRGSIRTDVDDLSGALEDLNEAIRLSPDSEDFYRSRAYIWRKLGQRREEAKDLQRFEEILEKKHHHFEHESK